MSRRTRTSWAGDGRRKCSGASGNILDNARPCGQEGGMGRAHERMGSSGARRCLTTFGRANDDRRRGQNVFWAGDKLMRTLLMTPASGGSFDWRACSHAWVKVRFEGRGGYSELWWWMVFSLQSFFMVLDLGVDVCRLPSRHRRQILRPMTF